MHLLPILLVTLFLSASSALLEYGTYWYTEGTLHFSQEANLVMAVLFGLGYAGGAFSSHWMTQKVGEKPLLIASILIQMILSLWVVSWPTDYAVFTTYVIIGTATGYLWPVVEHYLVSGRTPKQSTRAIGQFNMTWGFTSPIALAGCGAFLKYSSNMFWIATIALNLLGLLMVCFYVPKKAIHLADTHPEKPSAKVLAQAKPLLSSARMGMVVSYMAVFILAPLMPKVLKQESFGLSIVLATILSAAAFSTRWFVFWFLGVWHGWHMKKLPLILAAISLPIGVYCSMFSPWIWLIIVGQVIMGIGLGLIYVASFDYGMIVKNASVEGGGGHEAAVGFGFAMGPLLGLLGAWLGRFEVLGEKGGMALGLSPLILFSLLMLFPLLQRTPRVSKGT